MLDSKPSTKKIIHPEFAQRMQSACDSNPNVPPQNHGRLGWFSTEIERRFHKSVTIETVRKWMSGETIPRPKMMGYLAAVLEVDHAWLAVGSAPDLSQKEKRVRDATADGAVNLVAGMIQMDGGHPAFPVPGDDRAAKSKVDLYAVIKGVQYAFHVAVAQLTDDGAVLSVPAQSVGEILVLAIFRTGAFSYRIFELEAEKIKAEGKRKADTYAVQMPAQPDASWKEIQSFSQRL